MVLMSDLCYLFQGIRRILFHSFFCSDSLLFFKALKMGIIFGILIDDEVSWWLIEFIGIKT